MIAGSAYAQKSTAAPVGRSQLHNSSSINQQSAPVLLLQSALRGPGCQALTEPERLAAAVRRALPELRKLDRYERRAALLRERSVRAIKDRTYYLNDLVVACSLVRQCPSNWSQS